MKTTGHTRAGLAAGLLALIVASGACSVAPVATPTASGVLLTVETRGGMCPAGPCGMKLFVERDGRVHQATNPANELGVVPADALAALDQAIRATDFAELRSHPFTGTCPTAYDGQEVIFEFGPPTGLERIASCEVNVDVDAPLFVAVANAVGPFMGLQTP